MRGKESVIATFGDVDRAREAALALEREGIEGSSVMLETPDGDRVSPEERDTRREDKALSSDVGSRVGIGAVIGTIAGGVLGLVLGLLAFGGAGVWASTIGAAIAGGALGGVIGGVSGLGTSGAWQRTYSGISEDGIVVGVEHSDRHIIDKAERALRDLEPARLDRYDAAGQRIG